MCQVNLKENLDVDYIYCLTYVRELEREQWNSIFTKYGFEGN